MLAKFRLSETQRSDVCPIKWALHPADSSRRKLSVTSSSAGIGGDPLVGWSDLSCNFQNDSSHAVPWDTEVLKSSYPFPLTDQLPKGSTFCRQQSVCAAGWATSSDHWLGGRRSQSARYRETLRHFTRSHGRPLALDRRLSGHGDRTGLIPIASSSITPWRLRSTASPTVDKSREEAALVRPGFLGVEAAVTLGTDCRRITHFPHKSASTAPHQRPHYTRSSPISEPDRLCRNVAEF